MVSYMNKYICVEGRYRQTERERERWGGDKIDIVETLFLSNEWHARSTNKSFTMISDEMECVRVNDNPVDQ
jgi:hypothetical protein